MPNFRTTTQNFSELIKEIPKSAKKVKVIDQLGMEIWKKVENLLPTDRINISNYVIYTEFDKMSGPNIEKNPKVQSQGPEVTEEGSEESEENSDSSSPPSKGSSRKTQYEDEDKKVIREKISKKKSFVEADKIYQVIKKNPDSLETLQNIMLAFSEEQSSINFEKTYLEEQGIPASKLSMQRVRILQALSETWLNHKELLLQEKTGIVDLNSDAFGRLFKFIGETFTNVMLECGIDPQLIKMIIVKTAKQIDETWKAKALRKMMGESE